MSTPTLTCPACGKIVSTRSRFCPECGHKLPTAPEPGGANIAEASMSPDHEPYGPPQPMTPWEPGKYGSGDIVDPEGEIVIGSPPQSPPASTQAPTAVYQVQPAPAPQKPPPAPQSYVIPPAPAREEVVQQQAPAEPGLGGAMVPVYDHRPVGATRMATGFECPYCHTTNPPILRQRVSAVGWIVLAIFITSVICWPLFWIGLLIKEDYRVCSSCGNKV